MATRLEQLTEERQALKTELIQIQSMLYLVDDYIGEEQAREIDANGEATQGTRQARCEGKGVGR